MIAKKFLSYSKSAIKFYKLYCNFLSFFLLGNYVNLGNVFYCNHDACNPDFLNFFPRVLTTQLQILENILWHHHPHIEITSNKLITLIFGLGN